MSRCLIGPRADLRRCPGFVRNAISEDVFFPAGKRGEADVSSHLPSAAKRTRSSARWLLALLWPPQAWRLSSRLLAEPFPWPGLRRPSAVSDRSRRLQASAPARSFLSPHSPPSSGEGGSPAVFR